MPNFFMIGSRAEPLSRVTSTPSTRMAPSSGVMIPRMHLMVTDLPVPEPPMMTVEDCLSILRLTPSSTTLEPKRFLTPISSIFGTVMGSRSCGVEQDGGENKVGGENKDAGGHHRAGGGRAHALRAAL